MQRKFVLSQRLGLLTLVVSACLPHAAIADVLQIDGSGQSKWIAGGPAGSSAADPAGTTQEKSPGNGSVPAYVPLFKPVLTSCFGMRRQPILQYVRAHEGIDLAAPVGTPVYATAGGTVTTAGTAGGYGTLVQIDHGGNVQTRYGHLSRLNVKVGQPVRTGEVIGFVGTTGQSTGPHVHYEVRIRKVAVDPLRYMGSTATICPR